MFDPKKLGESENDDSDCDVSSDDLSLGLGSKPMQEAGAESANPLSEANDCQGSEFFAFLNFIGKIIDVNDSLNITLANLREKMENCWKKISS